jgi:hypothetical protein
MIFHAYRLTRAVPDTIFTAAVGVELQPLQYNISERRTCWRCGQSARNASQYPSPLFIRENTGNFEFFRPMREANPDNGGGIPGYF